MTRCHACGGRGSVRRQRNDDPFGGWGWISEVCMACAGTGRDLEPADLEAAIEALRNPPPRPSDDDLIDAYLQRIRQNA